MLLRPLALALSSLILLAAAPPPKTSKAAKPVVAPPTVVPATLPHTIAMFLAHMSSEGKQKVTFKAAAIGTRFFFEETTGVTVYGFDGTTSYKKEVFLKGYTLAKAMKKYVR
jgi:hypothetical protein